MRPVVRDLIGRSLANTLDVVTTLVGALDPMTPGPFEGRRNLVIVRAGDSSLHPDWLAGEGTRNWDLVVSYFGKDPDRHRAPDIVRIDDVGPKWSPLQRLLTEYPEFLDRYDYIWLPDDDLAMTKPDMNRFFDICRQYNLELAQPSLSVESPMNHPLLIHNRATHLRFSNFVEVMAPCFSADCLRRVLPTLSRTQSGWGIDWLWPRLVNNTETGMAVIDDVVIHHTRPLFGPNYDAMRARGESPVDEWADLMRAEGIKSCRIEFHKVVWKSKSLAPVDPQSLLFRCKLLAGYGRAFTASPFRKMLIIQCLGRLKHPIERAPASVLSRFLVRVQDRVVAKALGR